MKYISVCRITFQYALFNFVLLFSVVHAEEGRLYQDDIVAALFNRVIEETDLNGRSISLSVLGVAPSLSFIQKVKIEKRSYKEYGGFEPKESNLVILELASYSQEADPTIDSMTSIGSVRIGVTIKDNGSEIHKSLILKFRLNCSGRRDVFEINSVGLAE